MCGNASYTRALVGEMERRGHKVKVFDLKSDLFNTKDPVARKAADRLTEEWCREIAGLDYVNLQFEAQLYGMLVSDCRRRFNKLAKACKDGAFSITRHRLRYDSKKRALPQRLVRRLKTLVCSTQDGVNRDAMKLAIRKNGLVIVHTERDRRVLLEQFPEANVKDYPITINDAGELAARKSALEKSGYRARMGMPADAKIVAQFGFIGLYKDYATSIRAMTLLPPDYHLYIFSGEHPLEIARFKKGTLYSAELVKLVVELGLNDRVHFMGAQENDAQVFDAMLMSDYIVLPYLEVGQSGSAVASSAIECCPDVFLSRTIAFGEFAKYAKGAFFSFDMQNYKELADKIRSMPDREAVHKCRAAFLKKYNIKSNIDVYLSVFDKK
jgi:glycosyltransferase involved in cell wall biosynthesis